MVLIAMSLPPFFLFILGVLLTPPRRITADTPDIPKKLRTGQEFVFTRKVTIDGGVGTVKILQKLPDEIELLAGNNLKVLVEMVGDRNRRNNLPPALY